MFNNAVWNFKKQKKSEFLNVAVCLLMTATRHATHALHSFSRELVPFVLEERRGEERRGGQRIGYIMMGERGEEGTFIKLYRKRAKNETTGLQL
jgi:hypothetical protein